MKLALLALAAAAPGQEIAFRAAPPAGLPPAIPAPADNPYGAQRFALGQRLFFDPILSVDDRVSCASCHLAAHGFSHPDALPPGVNGRRARRHPPALLNRAYGRAQLWDGRAATLEEQVLLPITDPDEMGLALPDAIAKLQARADYRAAFRAEFGADVRVQDLAFALATFVRGITFADSPADRFLLGARDDLTREERAGMWLYESKGRCWRCHPRPLFTDEEFHNTGVGVRDGVAEPGRMAVTGEAADRGKFKTPTLRGLVLTPPYMHDGSLATLAEVVAFYRRGGNPNPDLSPRIEPLDLSDEEAGFLVAFLQALSRQGGAGAERTAGRGDAGAPAAGRR